MSGPIQVEKHLPGVRRPSVFSNLGAITFCLAIFTVFAVLARNASTGKSATFDEPASLFSAWAQTHYFDFRSGPENPDRRIRRFISTTSPWPPEAMS
jgi:hypothetical protein